MTTMDSNTVVHNEAKSRFELTINGRLALADFVRDQNRIIFTHTEVPVALRGQGFGSILAHAALEYAAANHLEVVPLCWFIARYIDEHPQYQHLLTQHKAA